MNIKKVVLIICAVMAVQLAISLSVPLVNDHTAEQVADRLENHPLPEETELIESLSKAGKLVGNGNGMQYFGAILIKSERSLDELTSHYSAYGALVQVQCAQQIDIIEHGSLAFESEVSDEGYYIVYAWGDGLGLYEMLDLRGH